MVIKRSIMLSVLLILITQLVFSVKIEQGESSAIPTLKGSSSEPLLLRYKWVKDQVVSSKMKIDMRLKMRFFGRSINMPINMFMGLETKTIGVNEDNSADLQMKITRIAYRIKSMVYSFNFDSAIQKKTSNPKLAPLLQIINLPFRFTHYDRGAVSNVDFTQLLSLVKKQYGQRGVENAKRMIKQATDYSVCILPLRAVKIGDVFDGGKVRRVVDQIGALIVSYKNRVHSVSKDKRYVVIQMGGAVDVDPAKGSSKVRLKNGSVDGWVLFDALKGSVVKSYFKLKLGLSMRYMGNQYLPVSVVMDVRQKNKL